MKNQLLKRLSSLGLVAALSVQMLSTVALAAKVEVKTDFIQKPVVVSATTTGDNSKSEIFVYDVSAVMPTVDDATTTIAVFDAANDWLVIKKPAITPAPKVTVTTASPDTTISIGTDVAQPNDFKQILKLTGVSTDVTSRIIPEATMPFVTGITADKITVVGQGTNATNNVEKGKGTKVTLTPTVTLYNNTVVADAGATYQWMSTPPGLTSVSAGTTKVLTVDVDTLPVGTHTYTLTATDNVDKNKSTSQSFTLKVTECTAVPNAVTVTPASGTLTIDADKKTLQMAATPVFDANCNGTHVNNYSYDWSIEPPAAGATIDSNSGLLTIDRALATNGAVASVTVKATVRGLSPVAVGTAQVALTYANACDYKVTAISFTAPIATGINADSAAAQAYPVSVTTTGTYCNIANHGINHGRVAWSINPATAGLSIDAATGTLTITRASLAKPTTTVAITATADNLTTTTNVTITRSLNCNAKITALGSVTTKAVSNSDLPKNEGNNRLVWTVARDGATLTMGANETHTGACSDYAAEPWNCPNKHTVLWALDGDYSNRGIAINPHTGIITTDRSKFGNFNELRIGIKATATVNGTAVTAPLGYIVIKNNSYRPPASSSSSGPTEQETFDDQWSEIEYKIEDAESKDTISVKLLEGNTDLPGYVLKDLRGRNVTAEFYMGGGHTWTVNGKNLKELPAYQLGVSLGVKEISNRDASTKAKEHDIAIVDLEHNGSMYGTYYLTKSLDSDYANKTVYLYRYDKNSTKLAYKGAAKVDAHGDVVFPFTSASTYVYTDRPLYGETGGGTTPTSPSASVGPPASSSSGSSAASGSGSASSSSSTSSSSSSSSSSVPSSSSVSSSSEISRPADVKPEEEEKPKKTPIIIPILFIVVALTVVAVILLAKNGMKIGD